jgi:hypothetical protein
MKARHLHVQPVALDAVADVHQLSGTAAERRARRGLRSCASAATLEREATRALVVPTEGRPFESSLHRLQNQ